MVVVSGVVARGRSRNGNGPQAAARQDKSSSLTSGRSLGGARPRKFLYRDRTSSTPYRAITLYRDRTHLYNLNHLGLATLNHRHAASTARTQEGKSQPTPI
jgi:hypothetical protein